ncbi:MAG: DNA-3-methyladenine glycosylase [Xanthobacteraceae bacterium]|jgi:DNA-3-methyladenine glycosylase
MRRLRRAELPTDAAALAKFLIGKTLIRDLAGTRITGRIVETEAYPPGDASGHAFVGPTKRNRSLFLDRGHAYVYFGYGLHYLLNVSAETAGTGAGVLLRAAEPVQGIHVMEQHRRTTRTTDLARGPARLAEAFAVDHAFDGIDLITDRTLWLATGIRPVGPIGRSVRIGITKAVDRELRFFERGSPFVSGPKWLNRSGALTAPRRSAPR